MDHMRILGTEPSSVILTISEMYCCDCTCILQCVAVVFWCLYLKCCHSTCLYDYIKSVNNKSLQKCKNLKVARFVMTFRKRIKTVILSAYNEKIQELLLRFSTCMSVDTKCDKKFDIALRHF